MLSNLQAEEHLEMSITINEYVHENLTLDNGDGTFTVFYEPLDNPVITSLTGTVFIKGKESHPFWWHRAAGDRVIFFDENKNKKPKALNSSFNNRIGATSIRWDRYIGDHFLCISYTFDETLLFEKEPEQICWLKEGF